MKQSPETVAFERRRLPHWEVSGGRYFVTINQAGNLPDHVKAYYRDAARQAREAGSAAVARTVFRDIETWLDRGEARADLAHPPVARMLEEAIAYRQTQHLWNVLAYVIMPNHLHLFIEVGDGDLTTVLRRFKRWTGRQANTLLGRTGSFWHREWFDHWSRSATEDARIVHYIQQNPVRAGLVENYREWPYGSWSSR